MTEIKTNPIDLTPENWSIPELLLSEKAKRLLRKACIPPYLKVINPILKKRYASQLPFPIDQWYWGGRGMAMEILHRKVCHFANGVKGKTILVVGCGTGRDIPSWLTKKPAKVIGVDCFNYATAWQKIQKTYPETTITFIQANLEQLSSVLTEPVDLIVSDAVFEHIRHMDRVLPELHHALKAGGTMYANFGPLYYSWGGDHISGYDTLKSGFNHVALEKKDYVKYLNAAGAFKHSEDDGRTWINNDLFSYLKPAEYFQILKQSGFKKIHHGAVIEPRAVQCLADNPSLKTKLLQSHREIDLIIGGLMVVYHA